MWEHIALLERIEQENEAWIKTDTQLKLEHA